MSGRYSGLSTLFGEEGAKAIHTSKVLLVGAGGIGSEMLKELVMVGVGEIHLVDLDTIDLSNLNRQFLFSNKHIKQPKATVAAQVAAEFNPNVHIVPYHANIMDSQFSPRWFRSFSLVFNALDNAEARRYVNRQCVASRIPLIDAGTAGFDGQVQVILPSATECYDCFSHPAPVTFPVCTIRSTPTLPIHSIVWARSFLFSLLYGADEEGNASGSGNSDFDETVTEENKDEIARLKGEQAELAALRHGIAEAGFVSRLVDKIFVDDIKKLLTMETMWQNRRKPVPLDVPSVEKEDGAKPAADDDQCVWTVVQDLEVLAESSRKLADRAKQGPLGFDKDDEDALNFVAAASNLRSHIFGLPEKSKFDIKEIAGNIIPAIATTNAIVSGLGVIEALKILAGREDLMRSVNIWRSSSTVLRSENPAPPNKACAVCSAARTTLSGPSKSLLLENLVEKFLKLELGYSDVSLVTDRLIYDAEFDDNLSKTLGELGLTDKFITVIDEDDRRVNLELYIADNHDIEVVSIHKVSVPNRPVEKRKREDEDENEDVHEHADENGVVEVTEDDGLEIVNGPSEPPAKRLRPDPHPVDDAVLLEQDRSPPEISDGDIDLRD